MSFKKLQSTELTLPIPPNDLESASYFTTHRGWLHLAQILSFSGATFSLLRFTLQTNTSLIYFLPLGALIFYFLLSITISLKGWNTQTLENHNLTKSKINKSLRGKSVDIFLPSAGEPLELLNNTYNYISKVVWTGAIKVFVLDDSGRKEVKQLAERYKFEYISRKDKGFMKKAGNLRNAFPITDGDFIAIFDADFVPRSDYFENLMPYFMDKTVGIVQSPQYFHNTEEKNWLERGAGQVQELFYRLIQSNRSKLGAAICVGSCAIYRREALEAAGGFANIEHSEDVHTGFALIRKGYRTQYVPMPLSTGVCPDNSRSFFNQQYRWAAGSISLMRSKRFWDMELTIWQRMCFLSGFFYYIMTGFWVFFAMIPVIYMSVAIPQYVLWKNYIPLFPSLLYTLFLFPKWHRGGYSVEATATKVIYGFAHMLSIIDTFTNRLQGWVPTGGQSIATNRYQKFRILNLLLIAFPSLAIFTLTLYRIFVNHYLWYDWILMSSLLCYQFYISIQVERKCRVDSKESI